MGFCIAVLGIGSLAACNNGAVQAGQVSPTVTHSTITLPSPYPSGDITISGAVQAGAEPSCLIVTDSGRQYLLLSANPIQAQDGDVVKATGHIVSGIMTHCMQGIPFEVTRVSVLSHG